MSTGTVKKPTTSAPSPNVIRAIRNGIAKIIAIINAPTAVGDVPTSEIEKHNAEHAARVARIKAQAYTAALNIR